MPTYFSDRLLVLRRELGDTMGVAASLNNLGNVAQYQGDYDRAQILHQESLALRRELGDRWGVAGSLSNLANVAGEQGDVSEALTLLEDGLALRREIGDTEGIALTLGNLGVLARYQGDHTRATTYLEESLALRRSLGEKWGIALTLANLGNVSVDKGAHDRALAWYTEGLELCRSIGNQRIAVYCVEGVAAVGAAWGYVRAAARLSGAAASLRSAINAPLPPSERAISDRTIAAALVALNDATFAVEWAAGQTLAPDQTFAETLAVAADMRAPTKTAPVVTRQSPADQPTALLSPREREIVALIVAGRTNRQIAVELRIAERTAATHVGNILRKLDLPSREHAAAWVRASRPVTDAP